MAYRKSGVRMNELCRMKTSVLNGLYNRTLNLSRMSVGLG